MITRMLKTTCHLGAYLTMHCFQNYKNEASFFFFFKIIILFNSKNLPKMFSLLFNFRKIFSTQIIR